MITIGDLTILRLKSRVAQIQASFAGCKPTARQRRDLKTAEMALKTALTSVQ